MKGPPARIAFDDGGEPTKAAEGFARKNGVETGQLFRLETDKGDYVAARVRQEGRTLPEVVTELGERIEKIPFPKRMRWGFDRGPTSQTGYSTWNKSESSLLQRSPISCRD